MLPPPISDSNPGSLSQPSSSSRKRKHSTTDDNASGVSETARSRNRIGQSSVSSFSASVREKVRIVDNGEVCWHCRASTSTDICHVVGQKDLRFPDLVARGLICFTQLSHVDNAIPLCPTCHRNFDDALNPGFIFIPADLQYFIDFERADQARRRSIMSHALSIIPARAPPTAESYRQHMLGTSAITDDDAWGLYLRYTLRKYFSPVVEQGFVPGLGPIREAVPWHGSPMAALRRAFRVLGDPLTIRGVPRETREMLTELVDLYAWDPSGGGDAAVDIQQDGMVTIGLSRSSLPPPPDVDGAEHEREPRRELPPTQTQTHPIIAIERTDLAIYPSIIPFTSPPAHNNDNQRPSTAQPKLIQTPSSPSPSQKKPTGYSHSRWKWGPSATSWDAMCFYTALADIDGNRSPKRQKTQPS